MRRVLHGVIVLTVIGPLLFLPAKGHAQAPTLQIVSMYMTTEQAYDAFSSKGARPPKVEAFPQNVANVGVYIDVNGAKAQKTSYRVGFRHNGTEVRHGALHMFDKADSETVLSIPADELATKGTYKATLYVNGAAAMTVSFSVISTPVIDKAYMITAKAWDAYGPKSKTAPAKTTRFPAGVDRVGAYFSYTGMVKTDVHYVGVYNANGRLVFRSQDHAAGYVPGGDVAIILPADAGSYPKGKYRTDLYINGAMVKSIPWSTQ